ncbi:MAG: acyltransferase [Bacteroidetes bacterium]|nr:acyltransferase [Bacteroidota bacterium]
MRGISALIILVIHYSKYIYGANPGDNLFLEVIEFGKYTVQFFFVLSGLLIFMTLDRSSQPKYFIVSRFARLYPAYWVCMSLTALVITLSPYYNYHPVTAIQYIANLTMFQHWMFIEDMDGAYWTLAVEMCFYILIFLVFIFKKQEKIERIGIVWLVLMVAVFAMQKYNVLPTANYYYFVPLLKNGNLFLGGIFFYQLKKNPDDKRKYLLLIICLVVHFIINPIEEAIAISIIFFLLYLFVIDKLKLLRGRILFFLGYICYPLYLLHQYIGYEVINFLSDSGIESGFLKIGITALIIIAMATIVTMTVERPAMKFIRGKLIK